MFLGQPNRRGDRRRWSVGFGGIGEPPSAGVRTATTGSALLAETAGGLVAAEQDEKTSISSAVVTANRVMEVCLGLWVASRR